MGRVGLGQRVDPTRPKSNGSGQRFDPGRPIISPIISINFDFDLNVSEIIALLVFQLYKK